jgi:hypothetical protein
LILDEELVPFVAIETDRDVVETHSTPLIVIVFVLLVTSTGDTCPAGTLAVPAAEVRFTIPL